MRKKGKKGRSVRRNKNVNIEPVEVVNAPHSFVIHRGLPGGFTFELTKDFRKVMEPYTASSLKEKRKNNIKDFVSVAAPLHVTHMCIFSRTELGIYLKLIRLPRGPTLTFKVHNFSLAQDVISSLKKQVVIEKAFRNSPLIILNNFSGEGLQMKLMASMFQNMFPNINLSNADLNDIRRCVLLNYNTETKMIDFRHYTIKVTPVGISKGVKKVVQGKIPNLSKCEDMSDFFTKAGIMSESEAEDNPANHVTLPQDIKTRGNMKSGKSALRLSELGPRMTLQLLKIEDGLLDGEVLYHDLIHKTEEEKLEIQKKREQKRKLKEKRKKTQEENKAAKEKQKQEHKEKSLKGMEKLSENQIQMKKSLDEARDASEIVQDDDAEYYKQEVGENPDKELFSSKPSAGNKRPPKTFHSFKNKRMKFNNKPEDKIRKKKNVDKTNSHKRDHRPIGSAAKQKQRKRN